MQPTANQKDHRFKPGDRVEYGTRGIYGGDRLGEVVFEKRAYGRDGYLIRPLSIGPGDGRLPSVYPADMVHGPMQPKRWAYDSNGWHRTYAEIPRRGAVRCATAGSIETEAATTQEDDQE